MPKYPSPRSHEHRAGERRPERQFLGALAVGAFRCEQCVAGHRGHGLQPTRAAGKFEKPGPARFERNWSTSRLALPPTQGKCVCTYPMPGPGRSSSPLIVHHLSEPEASFTSRITALQGPSWNIIGSDAGLCTVPGPHLLKSSSSDRRTHRWSVVQGLVRPRLSKPVGPIFNTGFTCG